MPQNCGVAFNAIRARTVRLILCVLLSAIAPLQQTDSRIWIGRYAEFEAFLRTAEIVDTIGTPVGITSPRHAIFKPGSLASGGALKAIPPRNYNGFWESYKSEIAAYKLDRLLALDMVPPTVEVRVGGAPASLQLWIENTIMLKEVQAKHLQPADGSKWNPQLHRTYLFDDLVANIDENAGNLLFDPEWNFIKIDHSRAFTGELTLPFEIGTTLMQIDRPFFDRVKRLDREAVARELGGLLEPGALDALFVRRDAIVKAFERLAAEKGAKNVFVP